MKIKDFEKLIQKYSTKKTNKISDLEKSLTHPRKSHLYGILKNDNMTIYIKTIDDVHVNHLVPVCKEITTDFASMQLEYIKSHQPQHK